MGHNVSPGKRAAAARSRPLNELHAWRLAVDCGGPKCARGRTYAVSNLAGAYPRLTLGELLERMRCTTCGRLPVEAVLRPWDPSVRRHGDVPVLGPGSW